MSSSKSWKNSAQRHSCPASTTAATRSSLNAGAGGTEAMDWCSMLYRMYQPLGGQKGLYDRGA